MYDDLSSIYDRFVNWQSRLDYEMPFIEDQLARLGKAQPGGLSIVDAACGTGGHAIALAQRGYRILGADLSLSMIEQARLNAARAGVSADFLRAGFGTIAKTLQATTPHIEPGSFDAVLCLGNSLPHVLTREELNRTLEDFGALLRPGGLLMIQNRNFNAVLEHRERWMEPQSQVSPDEEWLFLRFYDFRPDGLLGFNLLTLHRKPGNTWQQRVHSTLLYPLQEEELKNALTEAGFGEIESYGDMQGNPFDPKRSGNLILICRRSDVSRETSNNAQ